MSAPTLGQLAKAKADGREEQWREDVRRQCEMCRANKPVELGEDGLSWWHVMADSPNGGKYLAYCHASKLRRGREGA